jgi:pimeloyl-ACP methyl ester carboxylesterase
LGSGIRTIAPDLRGFGKTMPAEGEPSLEAMADDVLDQLKKEGIERAVVAGMSMGGYVALAIADRDASRIAGLALVNSQVYADTDETRAGRREMIKKIRAEGPGAAAQAAIPKLFAPARASDPDFQRFAIEGAEKAGVGGLTWALEAMARRPDRSKVIEEANFPLLILHSTEDRFIPVEKATEMAALNREAHMVIIKGAGHCAAIETPDEVASTLRKFLEICSTAKATA